MNYDWGARLTISKRTNGFVNFDNKGFRVSNNLYFMANNKISDTLYLVAGKPYWYEFTSWIQFSNEFAIQWTYLGTSPTNVTTVSASNMPTNEARTAFLVPLTATGWPTGVSYSIPGFYASKFTPNRTFIGGNFKILGNRGELETYPYYDFYKPTSITGLSLLRKTTNRFEIKWNRSFDATGILKHNIYVNGVVSYSTSKDVLFKTLENLIPDHLYSIFVTAVDENGNESTVSNVLNEKTLVTETNAPFPPTTLQLDTLADISVKVSWSGATDDQGSIYGYKVYVDGILYTSDTSSKNSIILKTFQPNSIHNFQVQAIDGNFNISTLSSAFTFTTVGFDALLTAPGVKKAAIAISKQFVGKIDGFGINGDWDNLAYYNSDSKSLHVDLNPGLIRWGTIRANKYSYQSKSGVNAINGVSYARFIDFANQLNAASEISIGTDATSTSQDGNLGVHGANSPIDWRDERILDITFGTEVVTITGMQHTVNQFINYLFAPDSMATKSIVGSNFYPYAVDVKKRLEEGYVKASLTGENFKGLIIEFGSEPWDATIHEYATGTNHNADGFNDYAIYGIWCRKLASYFRLNPYFDSTKVKLAYSGREPQPANSYGLHDQLLYGSDMQGKIDILTLGGYLALPLLYYPIPINTRLDYYKQTISMVHSNINGLFATHNLAANLAKKYYSYTFYESSMTTFRYSQRFGQAVMLSDYLLTAHKAGAYHPAIYSLTGEWGITNHGLKYPMFNSAKLLNSVTKGNKDILNTTVTSFERLKNAAGSNIGNAVIFPDQVSSHIYHKNGMYSLVLISRDFENDYYLQLKFPSGILPNSTLTNAGLFVLKTTGDYDSQISSVTSSNFILSNNMIIQVPKYSLSVITFSGEDLGKNNQKLGFINYNVPEKLHIVVDNPSNPNQLNVSEQFGNISFKATVTGGNSVTKQICWTITKPDSVSLPNILYENDSTLRINATDCRSNGTITITAHLFYNPNQTYTYEVTFSNQFDENLNAQSECPKYPYSKTSILGLNSNSKTSNKLTIFPNPAKDKINIENALEEIEIYNFLGSKIYVGNEKTILISSFPSGIYVVKSGKITTKFVKE